LDSEMGAKVEAGRKGWDSNPQLESTEREAANRLGVRAPYTSTAKR